MRYQGGKSRIAKNIAGIINSYAGAGGRTPFVSLFCGSCAVESKIRGFSPVICNDKHAYLISLLRGVQAGYDLPDYISEELYRYLRDNKDLDPVLAGFAGFGCSFGGKWFAGYARTSAGTNFAAQSKKSLLKDMAALQGAWFTNVDYRNLSIPQGAVIYADPPYDGTTGYQHEHFDSAEFWQYARLLAQTGHLIFISEETAPRDFVSVWQKPFTRTLDVNKDNQFRATENLFVYGG